MISDEDINSDAYRELLINGMFRYLEGIPLSGSDADFTYDDEEYREYAKILGLKCVEVHHEP
jgi:hypothetical protein